MKQSSQKQFKKSGILQLPMCQLLVLEHSTV